MYVDITGTLCKFNSFTHETDNTIADFLASLYKRMVHELLSGLLPLQIYVGATDPQLQREVNRRAQTGSGRNIPARLRIRRGKCRLRTHT